MGKIIFFASFVAFFVLEAILFLIVVPNFLPVAIIWMAVAICAIIILFGAIREYRAEKKRPTFAELLAACKQDWVDKNFNEKNFPPKKISDGAVGWEIYEHHFNQPINGFKALKELECLGYCLCDPRRAMDWIANGHLDVQLYHPLIIPAYWQKPTGGWFTPIFDRYCNNRFLYLYYLGFDLYPYCGWLVLRRKTT